MHGFLTIAACFALVACSEPPSSAPKRATLRAKRAESAEAAMAVTPIPRRYKIDGNDLLVLEVPGRDADSGMPDRQRCYVWRDAEYKTATITCPTQPELIDDPLP